MNVITHLLAGWAIAEHAGLEHRERAILAWASVAPDLDGLGMIVDVGNKMLGREETFLFGNWHHQLLHGLPGAVVIAGIAALVATSSRLRVGLLAFGLVHLHLLCDLVGARGPSPEDIWPIWYLAPFSHSPEWAWSHQWALNAWPNIALTLVLVAYAFVRAERVGHSPVSLFSQRAHVAFVHAVRQRWAQWRGNA